MDKADLKVQAIKIVADASGMRINEHNINLLSQRIVLLAEHYAADKCTQLKERFYGPEKIAG